MADKTISELPTVTSLDGDSLFVAQQQGVASKVTGAQLTRFANVETAAQVAAAQAAAQGAAASETAAETAKNGAETAQTAIENMTVEAETLAAGAQATVQKIVTSGQPIKLLFGLPTGPIGPAGGVDSFNGRAGEVVPQTGDYTAEMVGAAPDGFGLGGIIGGQIPDSDFNMAIQNGWYGCNGGELNGPEIGGAQYTNGAILFVKNSGNGRVKEQILNLGTAGRQGLILRRYYHNILKLWQPWEWVNPPMLLGVEYRTVERYNGKPVYAKAISLGVGPGSNALKSVSHGSTKLETIVNYGGSMNITESSTNPFSLPGLNSNGTGVFSFGVNHSTFIWKAENIDLTLYTGTGWLKYTKTTD